MIARDPTLLRIVKMESALRIIQSFAKAAKREKTFEIRAKMIDEILREAMEALK